MRTSAKISIIQKVKERLKIFVFVLGSLILLTSQEGVAQQRPVYSQYMFNGLAINPAYAGSQKQLSATAVYRDQWVNFEGAPTTKSLGIHTGFAKKKVGIGLMVSSEEIGVHKDLSLYASYAYKLVFRKAVLSMGLQAGFNNLQSDFSKLNLKSSSDPFLSGNLKKFNPNFGAGLFYSTNTAYVGLSVPYIVHNRVVNIKKNDLESLAREARYYFLTGGKVFDLSPRLKVKPSTLLRIQEGAPLGVDLNGNLIIDDLLNLGASYRSGDSMIFLFELKLNQNFRFGYAYDYVISDLNPYTNGSHEIMLNYSINLSPTPCHTYF